MSVKLNPREDFVKGYRFLRVPVAWLGENFTKGILEIYILTKSEDKTKFKLYRVTYIIPLTIKFIKFAYQSVKLKGRKIILLDSEKLAGKIIEWEDKNKIVITSLDKEFKTDFETVIEEILALQLKAKERGWLLC